MKKITTIFGVALLFFMFVYIYTTKEKASASLQRNPLQIVFEKEAENYQVSNNFYQIVLLDPSQHAIKAASIVYFKTQVQKFGQIGELSLIEDNVVFRDKIFNITARWNSKLGKYGQWYINCPLKNQSYSSKQFSFYSKK